MANSHPFPPSDRPTPQQVSDLAREETRRRWGQSSPISGIRLGFILGAKWWAERSR